MFSLVVSPQNVPSTPIGKPYVCHYAVAKISPQKIDDSEILVAEPHILDKPKEPVQNDCRLSVLINHPELMDKSLAVVQPYSRMDLIDSLAEDWCKKLSPERFNDKGELLENLTQK